MHLLAIFTEELVTLLALDGGLILLTQLTSDIIRINLGTGIGSRHHPSSEVVDGEILNSLQWNLEWTMALWTLDFPAGGLNLKKKIEEFAWKDKLGVIFGRIGENGGKYHQDCPGVTSVSKSRDIEDSLNEDKAWSEWAPSSSPGTRSM